MDQKMKDGEPLAHADNPGGTSPSTPRTSSSMTSPTSESSSFTILCWIGTWCIYYSQSRRPEVPLQLIKDVTDVDEFFPANIDTLTTQFPVHAAKDKEIKTNHQDYIYATVLFQLSAGISSMSVCPEYNTTKQQEAMKQ